MKIGLVSPYVYPLPGGVTQHVRYLYENLRLRGHDVRIITSSHGLQRSSEGDVIRIGKGFSVPANGSMGTLTVSLRYASLVREVLDQERFDVLHFHEPLVPFLSPLVLRESRSVNVATFHAYAGYSPAVRARLPRPGRLYPAPPRADRRERRRPSLHRPLLRRRLQGHPERRGRRPLRPGRADRPLAGRHAEPAVRRPLRTAQGSAGTSEGLPGGATERLPGPTPDRRLRTPRARGEALRGDPTARRGRVPRARPRRREGRAVPDGRHLRLAGDRARVVRHRAPRGDGRRARPWSAPTSMATRASSAAESRLSWSRRAIPPPWRPRWGASSTTPISGPGWAGRQPRAREFSWERVTEKVDDYYGFVIRPAAAAAALPTHFRPGAAVARARQRGSDHPSPASAAPLSLGRSRVLPARPGRASREARTVRDVRVSPIADRSASLIRHASSRSGDARRR